MGLISYEVMLWKRPSGRMVGSKQSKRKTSSQHCCCTKSKDWLKVIGLSSENHKQCLESKATTKTNMWRLPSAAYDWPWYLFVLKGLGSKNTMVSFGMLIVKMFSWVNLQTTWVLASQNIVDSTQCGSIHCSNVINAPFHHISCWYHFIWF